MSNEALDHQATLNAYNKAVFEDYLKQQIEFAKEYPYFKYTDYNFVDYLLCRMYHEGLPEKEPLDKDLIRSVE